MRKILFIIAAAVVRTDPGLGCRLGGLPSLTTRFEIDWDDKAAMQRGARTYVNYCMSCHSAEFSRYNRVGARPRHCR